MLQDVWRAMRRCKTLAQSSGDSKLYRCLNLLDLTALGVGSTLGLGVYVLAGAVAKTVAGPAVCISFLIAAIASVFAGLCYSEFAARVPRAGSAYAYSCVAVGEFVAFTIGWNLILDYMIATASVAKGTSSYIDMLFNNAIRDTIMSIMPIKISCYSTYPDLLALLLILIATILLAIGVKESTRLNNFLTLLNISTVAIVVIVGCFYVNLDNWRIHSEDIPEPHRDVAGSGGFMPFGVAGVMAGAAKCFYGFVGFDCVATTGEEAIDPQRNIPLSIILSLVIIILAYLSMSMVITLMWPYYLQNADAPFPYVFQQVGQPHMKWIVSVGAIFALSTNVIGSFFPLPRIIYAMSSDGVLFKCLGQVNTKTKTPVKATVLSGFFIGFLVILFDLDVLINMMSIGTLLAYTTVAVCVLIMRYDLEDEAGLAYKAHSKLRFAKICKQAMHLKETKHPTFLSATITKSCISTFFVTSVSASIALAWPHQPWGQTFLAIFGLLCILCVMIIWFQPKHHADNFFTVPFLPILPCCSIFINLYLMVQLDSVTWIRSIVWLILDQSFNTSTDDMKYFKEDATNKSRFEVRSVLVKSSKRKKNQRENRKGTDEEFTISISNSNDSA